MSHEHGDSTQLELWPVTRAETTPETETETETEIEDAETAMAISTAQPARAAATSRTKRGRTAPAGAHHQPSEADPRTTPNHDAHLWSITEVAHYLQVSKDTIYGWRKADYGPPAMKIGKHLRWKPERVMTWADGLENEPFSNS